jgi:hypothetical protein
MLRRLPIYNSSSKKEAKRVFLNYFYFSSKIVQQPKTLWFRLIDQENEEYIEFTKEHIEWIGCLEMVQNKIRLQKLKLLDKQ